MSLKVKKKQKKREPNQITTKYNTFILISIFIPNAYVVHRFWFHKRRLIQRKSNKIFIPNKIFLPLLLQNIALLKFFISFTSGAFFRHYYYLLDIGLTVQSLAKYFPQRYKRIRCNWAISLWSKITRRSITNGVKFRTNLTNGGFCDDNGLRKIKRADAQITNAVHSF